MNFLKNKRGTGLFLVVILIAGTFLSGFKYQDGIGNVYYETTSKIFDDTYYMEQLAGHSTNGIQRSYIVSTDMNGSGLKPYVYEGEVTGNYTMNTMISTLESQGNKVVLGINGDIYDTSTGTPKGLTIHDGKIKTSGYAPEYVLSFDENGTPSLKRATLNFTLKGTINVPVSIKPPAIDTDPLNPDAVNSGGDAPQSTTYITEEYNDAIGFFNVPHGGSKGLHLYNRQFASATKTTGNTVEVVLEAGSAENAELIAGGTIRATVVEVRTQKCNVPIGDSQLILSTVADSSCAPKLSQLVPGSTIDIAVNDPTGNYADSKEAIGVYYVLYDNGQYISNGTNINPRTIVGIKPDGTMLFYVLDGRQPGFSTGLGLTDAAKHLVSLGCSTVLNLDGGGSSVMAVRKAGIDNTAVMKNSPSGGTQRKTTNGLFLVYNDSGNRKSENLHTYLSQPLAMPGADIQLSTYSSDSKYEKVAGGSSVNYSIAEGSTGIVSQEGKFTAGQNPGTAVIEVNSGGAETTAEVQVYDDITFTTSVQNLLVDPLKVTDINITAKYGLAPIASKDSLYTWSCDPILGTINKDGVFTAASNSGVKGNIYVEYKNIKKSIPVQVGPSSIDFLDTVTHWAKEFIGNLAARGIVSGMGDNLYSPDAELTRAQFLTMLSKTVYGLDVAKSAPAGFHDVPESEWYYHFVNWGFENGIVKGTSETSFEPNASITREQMAMMLNNFSTYTGTPLTAITSSVEFTDSTNISPWALESVQIIVKAGIMGGHPEGNFEPQGHATRAQAATVVYKDCNIRDSIGKL